MAGDAKPETIALLMAQWGECAEFRSDCMLCEGRRAFKARERPAGLGVSAGQWQMLVKHAGGAALPDAQHAPGGPPGQSAQMDLNLGLPTNSAPPPGNPFPNRRRKPETELDRMRKRYALMTAAQRKSKETREEWRSYYARVKPKHRIVVTEADLHRQRQAARLAGKLKPYFPRADTRLTAARVLLELTRVSKFEKGDHCAITASHTLGGRPTARISVMAARLQISRRTVQRTLRQLESRRLIATTEHHCPTNGRQMGNIYRVSNETALFSAAYDVVARRTQALWRRAARTFASCEQVFEHDAPSPIPEQSSEIRNNDSSAFMIFHPQAPPEGPAGRTGNGLMRRQMLEPRASPPKAREIGKWWREFTHFVDFISVTAAGRGLVARHGRPALAFFLRRQLAAGCPPKEIQIAFSRVAGCHEVPKWSYVEKIARELKKTRAASNNAERGL